MKKLELKQSVECKANNSKSFNAPSRKGKAVYQKQAYFFSVYKDQLRVAIQVDLKYNTIAVVENDGLNAAFSREWHGIVFGYNWETHTAFVYQEIEVGKVETIKQEVIMETKNENSMNELIKVTEQEGKQLVSARELHKFFESAERFSKWFYRFVEYGFEKDQDFTSVQISTVVNNGAKKEIIDYAVSIDMAKELSMLQRSEKGKLARRYFIECEKKLKESKPQFQIPTTLREALLLAAEQQGMIEEQQKKIEIMKPKEEFFDAVADSKTAISMSDVAKVLEVKGMGRNNMFEFLRNNGVLMSNNTPYQKYVDCGYFRVVEQKYMKNGEQHITAKTLVYQKGVDFIRKMINKQ